MSHADDARRTQFALAELTALSADFKRRRFKLLTGRPAGSPRARMTKRAHHLMQEPTDLIRAAVDEWRRHVELHLHRQREVLLDTVHRAERGQRWPARTVLSAEKLIIGATDVGPTERFFADMVGRIGRLEAELLEAAGPFRLVAQEEVDLLRHDVEVLRRGIEWTLEREKEAMYADLSGLREPSRVTRPARRPRLAAGAARGLTGWAAWLAGSRRASGREEWLADLSGVPEAGRALSGWAQLRYASGLLWAAVRMRLADLAGWAGGRLDQWLATDGRVASGLGLTLVVVVTALFRDGGVSQVVEQWEGVIVLAGSFWGGAMFLRRLRGVTPLPRRKKKDSTADR